MSPTELDQHTIGKIQELIEANFAGRDELYAAAKALDDEARQQVCRRLAEHLAGHAAELQQIVTACGVEPTGPLDMRSIAIALFDLAKLNRGNAGVLDAAVEGEQNLKRDYDRAMDGTAHPEAKNALRRQRDDVEFNEQVLRSMRQSKEGE